MSSPPTYTVECEQCSGSFLSKKDLLSHIIKKHPFGPEYEYLRSSQNHDTEYPKNNIRSEHENARTPQNRNTECLGKHSKWRRLINSGLKENSSNEQNNHQNSQNRQMSPKIDEFANDVLETNSAEQTSNDEFVNLYNAMQQASASYQKSLKGKVS